MQKIKYILYIAAISTIFMIFSGSPTFADNMSTNVNIRPSLAFSIPISSVSMTLNPAIKPFDSEVIPITVGTNNADGYQVFVNATGTDLVEASDASLTIPTLARSGYTDANFPANYWGYKLDSGSYLPFASGNVVSSSTGPTEKTTNMTLAAKIDYLQSAGTYEIALNFSIVPVVSTNYMQNMNPAECTETPMVITDQRDGTPYKVRRLADGNCWMIENLRFTGTELTTLLSNVNYDTAISYGDLIDGDSYDIPRIHSGVDNNGDPTVWYNYAAATAGTITGNPNTYGATQSICPRGWRLPSGAEGVTLVNVIGSSLDTFNPVIGGHYYGGTLNYHDVGILWTSSSNSSYPTTTRDDIRFRSNGTIETLGNNRQNGDYIRCILETRTLDDVTEMQQMTPAIASNTEIGASKTLTDSRDNQTYAVKKLSDNRMWMVKNLAIGCNGATASAATLNINNSHTSGNFTTPNSNSSDHSSYNDSRIMCNATYGAWYNYALTSAGTIIGESNSNAANYDICPLGWRLPTQQEEKNILSYVSEFGPVAGGIYRANGPQASNYGNWWASDVGSDNTKRWYMYYYANENRLRVGSEPRNNGFYIRCVVGH